MDVDVASTKDKGGDEAEEDMGGGGGGTRRTRSMNSAGLMVDDEGSVLPTEFNIRRLSKSAVPGSGIAKC